MLYSAKLFLSRNIDDPISVQYSHLRDLSEPAYISLLREVMQKKGVKYLHIDYWPKWKTSLTGTRRLRVYHIKSFVWNEQLYIIRDRFTENDFALWPSELQAIWQDTLVDVPTEEIELS